MSNPGRPALCTRSEAPSHVMLSPTLRLLVPAAVGPLLAQPAGAQAVDWPPPTVFSIDGRGPTITLPDPFTGALITAGDLLTPRNGGAPGTPGVPERAAPSPGIFASAGFNPVVAGLGLTAHGACVGVPPSVPCPVEVDALSFGQDDPLTPVPLRAGTIWFSVDEYAQGAAGSPDAPDLTSEGAGGETQAAASVFTGDCREDIASLDEDADAKGNSQALDGDGLVNSLGSTRPGFGLIEPSPPGGPPDAGDNLDAFDVGTTGSFPVFFSLDAPFVDPLNGAPLAGSAAAHGFVGGDVLVQLFGVGPPVVYAPAASLGLDQFGADTDDLDALALWDNGNATFEPSSVPYDWLVAGGGDMLLFSVRRGSAVIGEPDSRFGQPIEPGDILTVPLPGNAGGLSPYPAVFISAEALEVGTSRSLGLTYGDDLDGLDTAKIPGSDCNGNCIPDKLDIEEGVLTDINDNCTPDECEGPPPPSFFDCFCAQGACGNPDSQSGCANSSGVGGVIGAMGSTSVGQDDLVLIMSSLPPNQFGIFYMGPTTILVPFGDGQRCIGGGVFRYPIVNSGSTGTATFGPVVSHAQANFGSPGTIGPGATWLFQGWYRDPGGPCGSGFNLTNVYSLTFGS